MRLHTIIITLAALLGLAFAADAGGSRDDVVVVSATYAYIDDTADTITVPAFNPRLGTLTGVQLGVEVDATFDITATSSAPFPDPFAASWSESLSGSSMPPPEAVGQPGFASYSLLAALPVGGGVVGKSANMPVQVGTLLPGVPQNFFAFVDTNPSFAGPPNTDPAVLAAFSGPGGVDIPITTTASIWTVGCPQGTIQTQCSALGRVYVRYLYTPN